MSLTILEVKDFNIKLKCTVQATGRLGFTASTAVALRLEKGSLIKFAMDKESGNQLYMLFVKEEDENTFKVNKAGQYFYLPTQALFESLGFKLNQDKTYIYDLIRMKDLDSEVCAEVYKMKLREKRKKDIGKTRNIDE